MGLAKEETRSVRPIRIVVVARVALSVPFFSVFWSPSSVFWPLSSGFCPLDGNEGAESEDDAGDDEHGGHAGPDYNGTERRSTMPAM